MNWRGALKGVPRFLMAVKRFSFYDCKKTRRHRWGGASEFCRVVTGPYGISVEILRLHADSLGLHFTWAVRAVLFFFRAAAEQQKLLVGIAFHFPRERFDLKIVMDLLRSIDEIFVEALHPLPVEA